MLDKICILGSSSFGSTFLAMKIEVEGEFPVTLRDEELPHIYKTTLLELGMMKFDGKLKESNNLRIKNVKAPNQRKYNQVHS